MGGGGAPLVLTLASGSPRRRALLEALGYPLRVVPPRVAEEGLALPPWELALALAWRKGESVAGAWVLAADTVVDLEGEALGKPKDPEESRAFLRRLSGRERRDGTRPLPAYPPGHRAGGAHRQGALPAPSPEEEIAWYVASGEGLDKAGGYGARAWAWPSWRGWRGISTPWWACPWPGSWPCFGQGGSGHERGGPAPHPFPPPPGLGAWPGRPYPA
ncbi:MAG: Maf family protein, partial [Thermus sp.]